MPRVDLDTVRIGVSALTERVHVGTLENPTTWRHKVDRTNDFLRALLDWCPPGHERDVVRADGQVFTVRVEATEAPTTPEVP